MIVLFDQILIYFVGIYFQRILQRRKFIEIMASLYTSLEQRYVLVFTPNIGLVFINVFTTELILLTWRKTTNIYLRKKLVKINVVIDQSII